MTLVKFEPEGGAGPAKGYIEGKPVGTGVLPDSFRAVLVDGTVSVELEPTGAGWAWNIIERVDYGRDVYVQVSDSETTVDFDSLQRVDPDSLDPEAAVPPIYQAAIEAIQTAADSATAAVATIDTRVEDAVEAHTPGMELGYAEYLADFTTTDNATLNTRVAGLTIPVTGTGRPVSIEFFCPEVFHSVANARTLFYLVVNGTALGTEGTVTAASSASTAKGGSAYFQKRLVIPQGVVKTFTVGMFLDAAGTGHAKGDPSAAMFLSATSR